MSATADTRNIRRPHSPYALGAFAISPNDSTDLTSQPRAIYVGGAGDIACIMAGTIARAISSAT